jgi:hypothetical protein
MVSIVPTMAAEIDGTLLPTSVNSHEALRVASTPTAATTISQMGDRGGRVASFGVLAPRSVTSVTAIRGFFHDHRGFSRRLGRACADLGSARCADASP